MKNKTIQFNYGGKRNVALKINFMKLSASLIVLLTLSLSSNTLHAQSVGISGTSITPHASSILDIRTTTKGILIPRMTTAGRDSISSPATGLEVYNTTTNLFNFYNGSAWVVSTTTSNNLSVFAATTSAQLAGVLSDETGTGVAVFGTAPTFTTNITTPLVIGGTAAGSNIIYKSTTGTGTTTGIAHQFVGGTDGATVAQTILNNGKVGIGTTTPAEKLEVAGNILYQGVKNTDATVTTYKITTNRYHVSSRFGTSAGTTVALDMDIINELCGDADGCTVRFIMRKWDYDTETEGASRIFHFTYVTADGRWRLWDTWGKDGANGSQAIYTWWDCHLTDGSYSGYTDNGDGAIGLGLLNWNTYYTNANKTCECIFED